MSPVQSTIDWQGITLSVGFTPNWHGINTHHVEIHVIEPAGARLPVTDTGYRSHFFNDDVEQYGGIEGFVRAWLDEAATSADWLRYVEESRQMSLF